MYNVPCAHAPGTGRSHERIFSLFGGVHDVSIAEPFWKTCSQKSGSIPFSIQPLWEVCKCLRCLQSRLPLVEANRKADDAWRELGNGENEEEVKLLLRRRTRDSLRAVLSWINDVLRKDHIDYCQKMCDKPFGKGGGGREGVKPIWNALRSEKNCELLP